MDVETILTYVKFNLGLSTPVRDEYLKHIIETTISRTKRAGADPEGQDEMYQQEWFSYIVDASAYHYENRGNAQLTEGLNHRLNSLIAEKNYDV